MSRLDISPSNGLDLDERSALEHFFGKNQEDAVALFEENFGYYAEELTYMGNKAKANAFENLGAGLDVWNLASINYLNY